MRRSNLLVLQGGGPTPVLNATLAAVIEEGLRAPGVGRVLGARHGIEGLSRGDVLDLSGLSGDDLAGLRQRPGASLGTTRFKPTDADLTNILDHLDRLDVRYLILIGGNGSLRGAEVIGRAARAAGRELNVIAAPKTVDNDIALTDRCPGYASAARYVAQSVRDLGCDVRALPQPVSIYETMGRGVGWLAAASALARRNDGDAPHLVYLPEKPFDFDRFLADVDRVVTRRGYAVAVVNEGIRTGDGRLVYEISDATQRDACDRPVPGGVARFLAGQVTRSLKIRCRSEKPGLCGRASMLHVSRQDLMDAETVGRVAVAAALAGHTDKMVALRPLGSGEPCEFVPLSAAAGTERAIPPEWLVDGDIPVNQNFLDYVTPLVGPLVDYAPALCDSAPAAYPSDASIKKVIAR